MKAITKQQLELIARIYECEVSFEPLPVLSFGDYGFEATEECEGTYAGFKFFGDTTMLSDYIHIWNALTDPVVNKRALTVDLAKELIGKKVRVTYSDTGEEQFTILALEKQKQKQIGQNEYYILRVKYPDGRESTWPYEWQGIFRCGSGAERLFVEEI